MYSFIRSSFKTWNTMYQKTCIFHLILLGVPSSLALSVKNRRVGGGNLLNGQNPLNGTKVICRWSLKERKDCSDIIWNKKQIRILKPYLVRSQTPWTVCVFFCCLCFFPSQQWPCHNNIVTDKGFNLFDDCAAECVGRRVHLFFLGTQ